MNWFVLCWIGEKLVKKTDYMSCVLMFVGVAWLWLTGLNEVDYSLYPERGLQLQWLRAYLEAYKEYKDEGTEVSEAEVEVLYVQVNRFALVSVHCFHSHVMNNHLYEKQWNKLLILKCKLRFIASYVTLRSCEQVLVGVACPLLLCFNPTIWFIHTTLFYVTF